ncbi:MAG: hypothetical protein KatS3mg102_0140 [Planctomycetota bacterium]|nr:MAG: hypothetical protein KatS3mg102_0140 [Planctomycetota bacterium]
MTGGSGGQSARTRSSPLRWLGEALGLLLLLAALNAVLAPDDPGALRLAPHPLYAVPALIGARYGLGGGLGAGLLAGLAHLLAQLHPLGAGTAALPAPPAGLPWHLDPTQPLLMLLAGGVLGGLSERLLQREALAQRRARQAERERERLAERLVIAEAANRELERRIVEPAAGVARLYEAARRLEAMDEEALYPAVLEIASEHLQADRCAIYLLEGELLRLRAERGQPPHPERLVPDGLAALALRERRAVSARELLLAGSETAPAERGGGSGAPAASPAPAGLAPLLAAPLLDAEQRPFALLAVTAMPFLRLTEASRRILDMIAAWAARAVEKARYVGAMRERVVLDEALGVLRASYLQRRLAEELERAQRYRQQVALLVLEVEDWERVPAEGRLVLLRVLVEILLARLRRVDQVFRLERDGALAALLPHTAEEGGRRAAVRLAAAVHALGLAPYAPPAPLGFRIGLAAYRGDPEAEPPAPASLIEAALAAAQPGAELLEPPPPAAAPQAPPAGDEPPPPASRQPSRPRRRARRRKDEP